MAFKSLKTYNEERFENLFILRNDNDSADVIFLYRSFDDVLIADTHYIKSNDYSGYVQCVGRSCPACAKGIRVQSKLFIPLYNLTTNRIEFWDRNIRFENQLSQDVFEKYPNPCDFVFKITRNGVAGDINTTYKIQAIGRNTQESYEEILARMGISLPEHYETVCKDYSATELGKLLANSGNSGSSGGDSLPDYSVKPRGVTSSAPAKSISEVETPSYEPIKADDSIDMLPPDDDGSDEDVDDVVF